MELTKCIKQEKHPTRETHSTYKKIFNLKKQVPKISIEHTSNIQHVKKKHSTYNKHLAHEKYSSYKKYPAHKNMQLQHATSSFKFCEHSFWL